MRDAAIGKLTPGADDEQLPQAADATSDSSSAEKVAQVFVDRLVHLKRIVAGMGLGPTDAEDILQDVFVEASRRPPEFQSAEHASRWLIRVTVNRCLLEYRRRQRFRRKAAEILAEQRSSSQTPARPDQQAIRAEELEAVRQAMLELDGSLQVPLVLRYFCQMNSTQISEALELPAATVRSRLRRSRMILAKRLLERGIEP